MGYCRKCGNKLEENMAYCPKCGTPVAVPYHYENYRRYRGEYHDGSVLGGLAIAAVVTVVTVGVIIFALIAVGLLPAISFGTLGSGNLTSQDYAVNDFSGIEVVSGFNGLTVVISQGAAYSVKVTVDDNLQQHVNVHKSGDTLMIRINAISVNTNGLKAEITMPELANVDFSGGVTGSALGFNLTNNLNVELSGGSSFTLTGSGADLQADCSGGSTLNFSNFTAHNAHINFSGGSQGTVNLDGTLDANLSLGSHLYYKGNATLGNINTSLGSSISQAP
jgi:hypothetical protein